MAHRGCSQIPLSGAGPPGRTFEAMLGSRRDTPTTPRWKGTARMLEGVDHPDQPVADAVLWTHRVAPHVVCPPWH